MKRIISLVIMALFLTGCSINANSDNIIELLSSPKLSENESEIVSAITSYTQADVVLKYLKEGDNISPIQYIDINADSQEEAIVFYVAPSSSGYVRMAVLSDDDGVWSVVDDLEGFGSEVLNVSNIQFDKSKGNQLLVTYTFSNTLEKMVTVYYYEDGHFENSYSQLCQSYIVSDVTRDGNVDLIIGQPNLENRLPSIQLISLNQELEIDVIAEYPLDVLNADIQSIKLSKTQKSSTPAILIDYKDNQNVIHTQAISYQNREFISVMDEGTIQKIWEFDYPLTSLDIDDDNYLETATVIKADEVETLDYMEWTGFLTNPIQRKLFGVVDGNNQIFISLPEEWQGYTFLTQISAVEWSVSKLENIEELSADEEPQEGVISSDLDDSQENIPSNENQDGVEDENLNQSEVVAGDELLRIRVINPGTAFYKNEGEEIVEVGVLRVAILFSEEVSQEQKEIIYNNIIYLG